MTRNNASEQSPAMNLAPSMGSGGGGRADDMIKKITLSALAALPAFILWYLQGSIIIAVILFMLIIGLIFFRNQFWFWLLLIIIIVIAGFAMFSRIYEFYRLTIIEQQGPVAEENAKLNAVWDNWLKGIDNSIATQIACASGECPNGEVEGPRTSIDLKPPDLIVSRELYAGDPFEASSEITGLNLKMYGSAPNDLETIDVACMRETEPMADVRPTQIAFADISNDVSQVQRKKIIRCATTAVKTLNQMNEVNISATFPYITTGDLPICIVKNERRNIMLEKWGDYTNYFECNIDPQGLSKYNDGPVEMGIKVTQIPIPVKGDVSTELVIAIWNKWSSENGEVLSIESISIELPSGFSIVTTDKFKESCPFARVGDTYELTDKNIEPIKAVRLFSCDLAVADQAYQATEHIKATMKYHYRIMSSSQWYVKEKESDAKSSASASSGDSGASSAGGEGGSGAGSEGTILSGFSLGPTLEGHAIPATSVYITTFGGGADSGTGAFGDTIDGTTYYCAMQWPYYNDVTGELNPSENKDWWHNKKILIEGNGKAVVALIQDWGPATWVVERAEKQLIDVSPKVTEYLFGLSSSGWSDKRSVTVSFADQSLPVGPVENYLPSSS